MKCPKFNDFCLRFWVVFPILSLLGALNSNPAWAELEAQKVIKSGTIELGLQAGYYQSFTGIGAGSTENLNGIFVLPQLGYVVTDKLPAWYFSGALEIMLEPVGAHFFNALDASMFGGSVVFRYNFLSFGKWMPYWDLAAGMVWTDLAPRIPEQSTPFEFILHGGPGVQYFVTQESAVSLGVRFYHMSNANLGDRNVGINAVLGLMGFTFYFP